MKIERLSKGGRRYNDLAPGFKGGNLYTVEYEMYAFIDEAVLDVTTWERHREVYRDKEPADALELAKSFFYLNRTNISGIFFAYFNPPYVQKGPGLYKSSYDADDHKSLAKKIATCKCKWIVTYDTDALIEEIYGDYQQSELNIGYSANHKTIGKEKIILGSGLSCPECLLP